MGWTSWNTFFEENSQERMVSQIDALLELGLDKVHWHCTVVC